jgi:[protein-PII] uridylyltransferase
MTGAGAAAEARVGKDRNAAEIVVAAKDRRALFADLALAISSVGGNVVGARIFTSTSGEALDVFYVQDSSGAPFGQQNPVVLDRLLRALEQSALGEAPLRDYRAWADFGRAAAFSIAPEVTIDNNASDVSTVIEASGRDRPGLLEALARTLSEADLSVQSAHIDSYGERAVDAFYVVTSLSGKLPEGERSAAIQAKLVEVLAAAEPRAALLGRPKARSSAAR